MGVEDLGVSADGKAVRRHPKPRVREIRAPRGDLRILIGGKVV